MLKYWKYLLLITFAIASCDVIEPPYLEGEQQNNNEPDVVRKIVLEDFTGHLCPNCPAAAEIATTLYDFYDERLIVISIHAGSLSRPTGTTYNYDFRTADGDAINSFYGVTGVPMGMVNRVPFEGSVLIPPGSWSSTIAGFEDTAPDFKITISDPVEVQSGRYRFDAKVNTLTDGLVDDYYIVALILEDGIVKPQRTNDPAFPEGMINEYEHNHVLRSGLGSIWGDEIAFGGEADDTFSKQFEFEKGEDWVAENCKVVVYVMNAEKEIQQAEIISLIP